MFHCYEDLVLSLVVNANTAEGTDQEPHRAETLRDRDFRLRPLNFNSTLRHGERYSKGRAFWDWDHVCTWYKGNNLVQDMPRRQYVVDKLQFNPYEDTVRHVQTNQTDLYGLPQLKRLHRRGINLCPIWVDMDGSCLTHSVSVALTGSQIFSDALRVAINRELREHREHYVNVGRITEEERARFGPLLEAEAVRSKQLGFNSRATSMEVAYKELMLDNPRMTQWSVDTYDNAVRISESSAGKVLRGERYLEEMHIAALANILRRPIFVLAGEYQSGLFVPIRHNPEDCKIPGTDHASPPLVICSQDQHYIPCCHQSPEDYWAWAHETFPNNDVTIAALRSYEAAREGYNTSRIPEFVEEIIMYAITEGSSVLEVFLEEHEVDAEVRDDVREAFGEPELLQQLPIFWSLQEVKVECVKPLKDLNEMNAIFQAMGFEVVPGTDAVTLKYDLVSLNIPEIRNILFALYVLMKTVHQVPVTEPSGVLLCEEDVDKEIWNFCLNFTQNDDISVGVARLYCDPIGWDFNPALAEGRDPTEFTREQRRLYAAKFESLTGRNFREVLDADLELAKSHAVVDLRVQSKFRPRAFWVMQEIIHRLPYPALAQPLEDPWEALVHDPLLAGA